jgi:mevalonate pyrophosphate decarboxylase
MLLIAIIASVMVVAFLIATGSNKNIKSRTEHEADLLEKHFEEEVTPPVVEVQKKKAPAKKKKNLASKAN